MIIGHSFKTRVTMSVSEFCFFYDFLDDLMKKMNADNTGQSFRYKDIYIINSNEYYPPNIGRIYFSFRGVYEKNIDSINEYLRVSRLDLLDQTLEPLKSYVEFDIEMDFQYWQLLFEITDYFSGVEKARIEMNSEYLSSNNDWTPPDNFKDGTDDEQAIWESHGKS